MNHDGMAEAQALEDEIGKPVVTSHTATLWRVLSQAGETKQLLGYGRLMAETCPDLRRKLSPQSNHLKNQQLLAYKIQLGEPK
jgi:hypothetical protein